MFEELLVIEPPLIEFHPVHIVLLVKVRNTLVAKHSLHSRPHHARLEHLPVLGLPKLPLLTLVGFLLQHHQGSQPRSLISIKSPFRTIKPALIPAAVADP